MSREAATVVPLRRVIIGIVVLTVVTSAAAALPVQGQCQGGQCDEFDISEKTIVGTGRDGSLVRTRYRSWTREGFLALGSKEESGHVFCSATRPALITSQGERTVAVMLAPLSDWEYDTALNYYVIYFEVCHNVGSEVSTGRHELARKLGYKVLRVNSSRPLGLTRPESIFYFPSAKRRDRSPTRG